MDKSKVSPANDESSEAEYGDMQDFRKSVKAGGINKRAAQREMPDESILERVK